MDSSVSFFRGVRQMPVDGGGSQKLGAADSAAGSMAPGKVGQRFRLLITLLLCGGVVYWAGRVVWETRNPAVAAARNLRSSDRVQRKDAVQEVAMQGLQNPKDAIPALIGALEDKDEEVRIAAARALGFVSSYSIRSNANLGVVSEALTGLLASLKDPAPAVRTESARSIGILGGIGFAVPRRGGGEAQKKGGVVGKTPVDARVLAEVFTALAGDSDPGARLLAWQALGSVGPRMGIELPKQLVAGLENEPPDNHEAVIKALDEYGPAASAAVPFLTKLLKEAAAPKNRTSAAEKIARALGRVAPGSPAAGEAVAGLTEALHSESPPVRVAAIKALEQLGAQNAAGAIPKVQALESDLDSKVREAAKSAVKSLAKPPK
jgi:hypothetical protein